MPSHACCNQGAEYDAFLATAQKSDDGVFAVTTVGGVGKAAGLTKAPGAAVITNFPGAHRTYDGGVVPGVASGWGWQSP